MAPDRDTDTLETTDEPSLRDALESAFDEVESGADETGSAIGATDDLDEDGQPRDERGRWTKAQQEHYEAQQREQEAQAAEQGGDAELRLAPPPGWTPAAKAAYAALPPEVQEAVARREMEINNGFKKLQDYKGLDSFAEMARASGTTLKDAFERYKAAEDLLDRDFFGGTLSLCEMYGIHPVQLAQGIMAQYGGGQGQQGAVAGLDQQSALLARELAGIKDTVRTLMTEREQQEQQGINAYVSDFAQNNLYFEDVRKDMGYLIKTGQADSLEDAYDKACWMNPQIRDLLIKERAAPQTAQARVSQARRASGSLPTGAPAGNSTASSANSIRGALEEAWGNVAI